MMVQQRELVRLLGSRFENHLITSLMLVAILLLGLHPAQMAAASTGSDHCPAAVAATMVDHHPTKLAGHLTDASSDTHQAPKLPQAKGKCCEQLCMPGFLPSINSQPYGYTPGSGLVPVRTTVREGIPPTCPMRPPKRPFFA